MKTRAFVKKENYSNYRDAIKKEKNVRKFLRKGMLKDSFYN